MQPRRGLTLPDELLGEADMRRLRSLLFILVLAAVPTHAALEYLRFEGQVDGGIYYPPPPIPSDPPFGLAFGQYVYFDFAVNTALDVPGYPDEPSGSEDFPYIADFFYADYLAGTIARSSGTYGANLAQLGGLGFHAELVVPGFYIANEDGGLIDSWTVGKRLGLFVFTPEYPLGHLELTYRDSDPPAPIPLPATGWLFLAGCLIASTRAVSRKRGKVSARL
jgi:hypothetical protein